MTLSTSDDMTVAYNRIKKLALVCDPAHKNINVTVEAYGYKYEFDLSGTNRKSVEMKRNS